MKTAFLNRQDCLSPVERLEVIRRRGNFSTSLDDHGVVEALRQRISKMIIARCLDDREDIIQETLIAILHSSKLPPGADTDTFWAWVYRVTQNHAADFYRKRKREEKHNGKCFSDLVPDFGEDCTIEDISNLLRDSEKSSYYQEDLTFVRDLVYDLCEITRASILIKHVEGFTDSEVAVELYRRGIMTKIATKGSVHKRRRRGEQWVIQCFQEAECDQGLTTS